jgi:cytochrome c5
MERKIIMKLEHFILGLSLLTSSCAITQAAAQTDSAAPHPAKKVVPAASSPQQHDDEGQRIFQQNCSRCHNAPEGFSPTISGTIVRHMRVRASLSQEDERHLLHFLNP